MTNVITNATSRPSAAPPSGERTLLIVEDDKSFLQRLARAMEGRGFVVTTAESVLQFVMNAVYDILFFVRQTGPG